MDRTHFRLPAVRFLAVSFSLRPAAFAADPGASWLGTWDGPGEAVEHATWIAVDREGYAAVAGTSAPFVFGPEEIIAVLYDPSGSEAWVVHTGRRGSARTIAFDEREGSVIIAGSVMDSDESERQQDWVAKYDRGGTRLWEAVHGEPERATDYCAGSVLDGEGNIYLAGYSDRNDDEHFHTVLLKYGPDGTLLWAVRHDDPTGGAVSIYGIAMDSAGNIILVESEQVLKYDDDGNLLWSAPGGGYSVAVDGAGNILVAGYAAVNKLDPAGNLLWSKDSSGPPALIAVGPSGDVHVAGPGSITTYDPAGNLLWTRDVAGGGFSPCLLAVDSAGDIAFSTVSESTGQVGKLDPDGNLLWTAALPGNPALGVAALAVERGGAVHIAASSGDEDMVTLKYGPAGEGPRTGRRGAEGHGDDRPAAIAVDPSGGVAVIGDSLGAGRGQDIAIVRWAPDGTQLWAAIHDGPAGGEDSALAVAVDGQGNTYGVGQCRSPAALDRDSYNTMKYGPDGKLLWARTYGGEADRNHVPKAIAVDAAGNVAVTGFSWVGPFEPTSTGTLLYDRDGNQLLDDRVEGFAEHVAIEPVTGNVLVAGCTYQGTRTLLVLAYGRDGRRIGIDSGTTPEGGDTYPLAVALDADGNFCIAGRSSDSENRDHAFAAKYSPGGQLLWARSHREPGGFREGALAVAADGGDLLLTGYAMEASGASDLLTFRFDAAGELAWSARWDGPQGTEGLGRAVAVDGSGNILVAGHSDYRDLSSPGAVALVYDREGSLLREGRVHRIGMWSEFAIDRGGSVLVANAGEGTAGSSDFAVLKFGPSEASVPRFLRGDADGDGSVGGSVTDAMVVLDHLFLGGAAPPCLEAADSNGDGGLDLSDAIHVLRFAFLGGPPPPPPFPECGDGPAGALGCLRPGC